MPRQGLGKFKRLDPKITPEKGAVAIGSTPDGQTIWKKKFRKAVKQPTGKWRIAPNGQPVTPLNKLTFVEEEREFVYVATGAGQVFRNFNFRPDPAEQARRDRKAKVDAFMAKLAEAAVEKGIEPETLVAAIAEDEPEAEAQSGFAIAEREPAEKPVKGKGKKA